MRLCVCATMKPLKSQTCTDQCAKNHHTHTHAKSAAVRGCFCIPLSLLLLLLLLPPVSLPGQQHLHSRCRARSPWAMAFWSTSCVARRPLSDAAGWAEQGKTRRGPSVCPSEPSLSLHPLETPQTAPRPGSCFFVFTAA